MMFYIFLYSYSHFKFRGFVFLRQVDPVVKILCSECRGPGFNPWLEN